MSNVDLSVDLCGMKLRNPTILASGILGVAAETMQRVYEAGAGAITLKSLTNVERTGNKNPTILANEHYMMNAVGLSGCGVVKAEEEVKKLTASHVPIIASVFAASFEECADIALQFQEYGVDAIELNVSCPHTKPGEGIGCTIGAYPESVEAITKIVKDKVSIPIIVKLTPNVTDIISIAKAAEAGGADIIAAINTVGPGLKIDIESGKPILANKLGGISGPAVLPIALACIWKIYEAVKLPVIGMGGITTYQDAIEMIMAGATAVGIGTAVYYRGMDVFAEVVSGMEQWMERHEYTSLDQIRGVAHRE
jgi:dihydroorotate dehydrogenase (NAD+) catalytic subunit